MTSSGPFQPKTFYVSMISMKSRPGSHLPLAVMVTIHLHLSPACPHAPSQLPGQRGGGEVCPTRMQYKTLTGDAPSLAGEAAGRSGGLCLSQPVLRSCHGQGSHGCLPSQLSTRAGNHTGLHVSLRSASVCRALGAFSQPTEN